MLKFPLNFEVQASASSGMGSTWTSQTNHQPPITMAIPPEFMGPGGGFSPEDLFAMAVLNCIIATFKVYAEKSKVAFSEIFGKAILTVDKQPNTSTITVPHLDFSFEVKGAADSEKTRKVLDSAIKDCIVSNSIKSGKTFHIDIKSS